MLVQKDAPRRMRGALMIQGRTHRWLAERCGFASHSYIGRLLRGEIHSVSPDTAVKLAANLGLPMDDLFLPKASEDFGRNDRRSRTAA